MSWQESLQRAAFDGVGFGCKQTTEAVERSLALYEYPHRDGAEIEDQGQKARSISMVAVLWGDNYENHLAALLKVLNRTGAGELIHPIYGAITAQVQRYQVKHTEERPDYADIDITFLEDSTPTAWWATPTAQQKTDAVGPKVAAARDASTAAMTKMVPTLAARLRGLRARMEALDKLSRMTTQLRNQVNDVITAGLDALTYPSSLASDVRAIIGAIASAPRAAAARIEGSLAGFVALRNALWPPERRSDALAAPVLPQPTVAGAAVTERDDVAPAVALQALGADLVLRERSLELADAVGELLGLEADVATLTPVEIARMAAQTRSALQEAIESARQTLPFEDAYAVSEALRDVASAILTAAEAVILSRPPMVTWSAPANGNLLLIAHWRYGDASRADELARLNPDVARAVFVQQGQLIQGFAK